MPHVSIGLPVYNGEKYVVEALDSLLAQTYEDFEIVISDNASTDRTVEICRDFEARDPRIRYCRNEWNLGAAANFNRSFELSKAPLFHGSSHDDLYAPGFLEANVDALKGDPDAVLSYAAVRVVGDHGEPLDLDSDQDHFIDSLGDPIMGNEREGLGSAFEPEARFSDILAFATWCFPLFGVIRSETLRKTGLHGTYYGADKILLAELALQGRFVQLEDPLFIKRVHRGCTYYKNTQEKAVYDNTSASGIPQVKMIQDYLKMILGAAISPRQKISCLMSVASLTRRHGMWRRFLVPGPENYLGLSLGRSAR